MRAADVARSVAVALWAFVGAGPATGCGWGHDYCGPEDYVAIGPEVESVEECPPFPASCPVDCSVGWCAGGGLRCEDCARLQAWVDDNGGESPCVLTDTSGFARGFVLACGSEPSF